MKTKKCLTILLTLALVLSIAVMAFAAEKSGAALAAAHTCNVTMTQQINKVYAYKNTTQHTYHKQTSQFCPVCGLIVNDDTSLTTGNHSHTKTAVDSYEESGDTFYCYRYECLCGDIYYSTT